MHWEIASAIAQSRQRQLEREAATRRRIREAEAALTAAPAVDPWHTLALQLSPPPLEPAEARPDCRSDAA